MRRQSYALRREWGTVAKEEPKGLLDQAEALVAARKRRQAQSDDGAAPEATPAKGKGGKKAKDDGLDLGRIK